MRGGDRLFMLFWGVLVVLKLLSGLFRMIRRRWWVILVLAVIGAGAGYALSERANQGLEPLFEAQTYVEFESDAGERSRDTTIEKVKAAAEEARVYNAAAIEQRLGQISIIEPEFKLVFTARNRDRTEAALTAESLRAAYIDGTTLARVAERQARLDEIIVEAAEVLATIEELTPPEDVLEAPPEIGIALQARIDSLQTLHDALDAQLTQLNVNLVLAQSGDERVDSPEEIQAQIDSIAFEMGSIRSELVVIALENGLNPSDITPQASPQNQPATPTSPNTADPRTVVPDSVPEGGLTDQLTLDALEDRYSDLTSEFGDLFLEAESETTPVLAPVEVTDLTPTEVSAVLNAILGFLAGSLLGVGLLFVTKSARGNIYGAGDVAPLPVLAEMPTAGSAARQGRAERSGRLAGERAEGVRQMRHSILRYVDSSPTTLILGLSGVNVDDGEVSLLAVDVGNRLSASDRSVLVLDVNFDTTVHYEGDSGITVAKLLQVMRNDPDIGRTYFNETLIEGADANRLRVVAPGRLTDDPTDAVLTDGFTDLLKAARQHFDVVLAVLPAASNELTLALRQRLDGVLAVVVERVSRKANLETLTSHSDSGLAPVLGVALLTGPPGSKLTNRVRDTLQPKAPRGKRTSPSERSTRRSKKKKSSTKVPEVIAPAPEEPYADSSPFPEPEPAPTPAAPVAASPSTQPSDVGALTPMTKAAPDKPPRRETKSGSKTTPPKEPVLVDVAQATPNQPAPVSRARAVVDWIKEWPYNDMEPLPQLPRDRQVDAFDDFANPGR